MSCSTSCLPFPCCCYIVAKLMLVASHRPPPHLFSLLLFPFFFYTFTREIDTFIKGAAARTCVMMVVVVSLHECLVYYRNSVDRDAEKEKKNKQTKNTRLLPISRAVGGWSTRQHGEENKKESCENKTKNPQKMYAKRENGKIMFYYVSLLSANEKRRYVV